MIKVLHIVSSLDSGGVENMLYNYYLNIGNSKIHFDFIVHGDNQGIIEKKVKDMGSSVFHVTPKKTSLKKNISQIYEVIKTGSYDVVHCHQNFSNFASLYLAWRHKVPVRISHAHGCKEVVGIIEQLKNTFQRLLNKLFANYFFSCGFEAGKWLHGKKWTLSKRNILMNNAIDLDKFTYNTEVREKYRKKFNVEDKIVLLHVGRFSDEKNHLFMVDIMEQLNQESSNYILLLVGNGQNEDLVRKYVDDKGLSNNILFLGTRNDIAELMSASDLFLLPSKNEGFPVTLVEAQATGIKVLVSDVVTKETKLSDNIRFLPISSCSEWVEGIMSTNYSNRISKLKEIEDAGFSINKQAKLFSEWLLKVTKNYRS
jgi:glycosyltransferase involved in cell wall biosynthesis